MALIIQQHEIRSTNLHLYSLLWNF